MEGQPNTHIDGPQPGDEAADMPPLQEAQPSRRDPFAHMSLEQILEAGGD